MLLESIIFSLHIQKKTLLRRTLVILKIDTGSKWQGQIFLHYDSTSGSVHNNNNNNNKLKQTFSVVATVFPV